MKISGQQQLALDKIHAWLNGPDQLFRLFGYAGTGKTTLAKHIASGCTLFCAFTGKAAHVLREKGCNACTIHQLIYVPKERCKQRLKRLTDRLKALPDDSAHQAERTQLEKEIQVETKKVKSPAWDLQIDSEIKRADLVIVDECSMIDEKMARDLLSFGTKILECIVTEMNITETQFNSLLAPVRADVRITLTVIEGAGNDLYELDKQRRNLLAAVGIQNISVF